MSTWVGVEIDGLSVEDFQNHHSNWFFKPSDRVREGCDRDENERLPDTAFIGYRSSAASIRRRMMLHGYDIPACEDHFNQNLGCVIEAAEWVLGKEVDRAPLAEELSPHAEAYRLFLDAVKDTTLRDWLDALPEALSLREKISMTNDFSGTPCWLSVSGVPLVNAMLSYIPLYTEYSHTDLFNFPCHDSSYFQFAYLSITRDDAVCELNIAPLIESGYEEDFRDLDEIQLKETQPHHYSRQSIEETVILSATQPGNLSLQRMCYASIITAMEAYLGDILRREISSRPAVKERFVSSYPPFKDRKLKLSEIFTRLEKIDAEIRDVLDELSLHKIEIAKSIFRSTLLTEFPAGSIPFLVAAVKYRHDIVHRNGRDTDGNLLSIDQLAVDELARNVLAVTREVDAQILDGLLQEHEADKD